MTEIATKENKAHGDIFLPVNAYHTRFGRHKTSLLPHWHDEMEVTFIMEGKSRYRVNSRSLDVAAGDIIIVAPHLLHASTIERTQKMVSETIVFHPNFLGAQAQDLASMKYLHPLAQGNYKVIPYVHPGDRGYQEIKDLLLETVEVFNQKKVFYELRLKANLLKMVDLLLEYGYITEKLKEKDENIIRYQIQKTLDYIHNHISETLPIQDLARMAGFSESYFMALFKDYVGMSCVSYINYYRIQKAAMELQKRDRTILEVAMEHGYNNISYFNRRFKAQIGMTPKEYRAAYEAAMETEV